MESAVRREVLFLVDEGVDSARIHNISVHDLAGLEIGFPKADLEKL